VAGPASAAADAEWPEHCCATAAVKAAPLGLPYRAGPAVPLRLPAQARMALADRPRYRCSLGPAGAGRQGAQAPRRWAARARPRRAAPGRPRGRMLRENRDAASTYREHVDPRASRSPNRSICVNPASQNRPAAQNPGALRPQSILTLLTSNDSRSRERFTAMSHLTSERIEELALPIPPFVSVSSPLSRCRASFRLHREECWTK